MTNDINDVNTNTNENILLVTHQGLCKVILNIIRKQ